MSEGQGIAADRKNFLCISGSTGFIGLHLLKRARRDGWRCSVLVRNPGKLNLDDWNPRVVCGSIADPAPVRSWLSGGGSLVYLVPLSVGKVRAICKAAVEAGISRAVFVSNSIVKCRNLESSVRTMVLQMEEVIKQSQLAWTIVRPTMVFGYMQDRTVSRLVQWGQRTGIIPLPGRGGGLIQPIHVDDLCDAVLALVQRTDLTGQIYELGGGSIHTYRDVAKEIARYCGPHCRIVPVPVSSLVTVSWFGRKILRRNWPSTYQIKRAGEDKTVNNLPAFKDFGFSPRSFSAAFAADRAIKSVDEKQ